MPYRNIVLSLLFFTLFACSEMPDGTIVMNEETIENFFNPDHLKSWNPPTNLNLVMDQPVAAAEIPPVPKGQVRLYGTLDSSEKYQPANNREGSRSKGSGFKNSVYGMLGNAGDGGNAWFYADINPVTDRIIKGRAYLYGFNGGVCDMRESSNGSWGRITDSEFILTIDGYCHFPSEEGSNFAFALVIQGDVNPFETPTPKNIHINYIMDNSGKFASVPQNPQDFPEIYDYGAGTANVER